MRQDAESGFLSGHIAMNRKLIPKCLLFAAVAALMSGCLMRRTVTSNGETIEDKYVIKRPIKEALDNSN